MESSHTEHTEELSKALANIAERSSQLVADFVQKHQPEHFSMDDELGVTKAFMEMFHKLMTNPYQLAQMQMDFWHDYVALWQGSMMKLLGQETPAAIEPEKGDKRFKDEAWQENFLFDYLKQSYLLASRYIQKSVAQIEGLDEKTAKKINFYTRQYVDAMAPTNFAFTNPQVLRETVESKGANLIKGLNNLLHDLEQGGGKRLQIRMTDSSGFKLGENIATTKGKVIFQTDLMQLIQYEPTTKEVHQRPLLIIPPWINKYYILDLREKNSFVKWAVDQGYTVFVISWVNPNRSLAKKSFEDYLLEGPIAALDAIGRATGEDEVNAVGYCLGGTLLACTLAYLNTKKDTRIKSATFLASMIDFSEPGELGIFLDDESITALEKRMEKRGYLEGHEMATTFNMLRANELIWSFVVNNYLLGKDPFPFDLLHWNSDSTRMPAAMHGFYLRNMYQKNLLKEPGGITLDGVPIDVSKIKTPAYFLSTAEDHIAPWKTTYAGTQLLSGPSRFVLGGSGHIAGVINAPSANKYCYWTNDKISNKPEQWYEGAKQHEGSWWLDWDKWASKHSGKKIPARIVGKGKLKIIEDAPGSYVAAK